jgi:tetratricopeptide (TPR) repeat protein
MTSRINKAFPRRESVFAWPAPVVAVFMVAALLVSLTVRADDASHKRFEDCLKKADDLPDIAEAEAESWLKHGGGDSALLCRATAQFHRGEFVKSAQDFIALASGQKDPRHASLLYRQAGLAYTRAENYKESENEYGKALSLEQQDPDIWVDRATERAAAQNYWDAIADLDQALKIMPDMLEAVRLRGQVWFKLGMKAEAETDFRHAAEIQAQEDVQNSKARPAAAVQKP